MVKQKFLSRIDNKKALDNFLGTSSTSDQLPTSNITPNNESTYTGPSLRSVDCISSTIPTHVQFTVDELRRNIGFRNVHTLLRNFNQTTNGKTSISPLEPEPTINLGEVATIHQKRSNTTPVPMGESFGDTFHCNIGFGSKRPSVGVQKLSILSGSRNKNEIYLRFEEPTRIFHCTCHAAIHY